MSFDPFDTLNMSESDLGKAGIGGSETGEDVEDVQKARDGHKENQKVAMERKPASRYSPGPF